MEGIRKLSSRNLATKSSSRCVMFGKSLLGLVCFLLLTSVAMGQTKVIKLKKGGSITGRITKVKGGYEVTTSIGVVTTVKDDQILSITDIVTPRDEYDKRLKKIDPNSAEDHFALGEWAFRKRLLKIAIKELQIAKKLNPNHEKANLLLGQAKAILASRTGPVDPGKKPEVPKKKKYISKKELNRIRLAELDLELDPPERVRVSISSKTIKRFIKLMESSDDFRDDPKSAEKFRRWIPLRQMYYILKEVREDNWKIKDGILVRSDPKVFRVFRRQVWPLLLRSCASSTCHGSPKGQGKLKLYKVSSSDNFGVYTNFIILDMFTRGGKQMINRDHPERSLLLEYGLPRKEAKSRHPGKAIMSPLFRSVKDPRYRKVKAWINSLNGPPHPNYGVDYQPPFGPKKKKPAALKSATSRKSKPSGAKDTGTKKDSW